MWLLFSRKTRPIDRNRPRRTSFRPCLETLEDRCLLSGGALDPTFGSGGLVTTAIGSYSRALAVATYANEGTANDGKIVAAGDAYSSTGKTNTEYMEVVRYNLDGTPDRTFGGSGEVTGLQGAAWAVQVQPDGKVLAAGVSGGHFAVVRYNANGSLDTSFGSTGKVITTISKNSSDAGGAMVLQADGKIVVAGVTNPQNTTYEDLALVRYNANGTLDTSFGTGGKVTMRFAAPLVASFNDSRVNLAIDPNTSPLDPDSGKIVVGAQTHSQPGAVVVRYNTNGTLDTGFGTNHTGYVNLSNLSTPAVAVQSDDRIVVAGVVQGTTNSDIGLDRLNPDGTLDPSFGSAGVVVASSSPNSDCARSVTIQTDGKIVVAGFQSNFTTGDHSFLVARFNTNGSLDTSFGANGIATGGSNGAEHFAVVALEPDGRIVVAGDRQSCRAAPSRGAGSGAMQSRSAKTQRRLARHPRQLRPGRGNKCRRWRTTRRLCPAPGPMPALAGGVRWRPGVWGDGAPGGALPTGRPPPGSNATARFSPGLMRGGGSATSKKKWQTPPGRLRGRGWTATPRRGRRHLSSSGGVFPTFPATCPESHTMLAHNSANRRPRSASW